MASFYQLENAKEIRREIISTTEDREIGCTLKCKLNSQCKQAGILQSIDGRSICYILGEETDVSIYVDNFTLLKKIDGKKGQYFHVYNILQTVYHPWARLTIRIFVAL